MTDVQPPAARKSGDHVPHPQLARRKAHGVTYHDGQARQLGADINVSLARVAA